MSACINLINTTMMSDPVLLELEDFGQITYVAVRGQLRYMWRAGRIALLNIVVLTKNGDTIWVSSWGDVAERLNKIMVNSFFETKRSK